MKRPISKITFIPLALFLLLTITGCASGIPNYIHSTDDVEGSTIGVLSGTPAERLASDLGSAASFESPNLMLAALIAGDVDCIIMERTTAEDLISGNSSVRILPDPIMEYDLRIAVPLENTRLLDAINIALEELENNGVLRGIYNKYFARGNFVYEPPDTAGTRSGYLIVALPPDSPPLSFRDEYGRFVGMDAEVAVAVTDVLGVTLRVLEYDAWDLVTSVWHGRADFAMGWRPEEAYGLVHVSEPYAVVSLVVIVRR